MAAFVGNHDCVAIINNYVPKEDILYFTRKQPFEEEPKLSPELAKPLHDLVMMMNTHGGGGWDIIDYFDDGSNTTRPFQ